jgi:hypothetical protein
MKAGVVTAEAAPVSAADCNRPQRTFPLLPSLRKTAEAALVSCAAGALGSKFTGSSMEWCFDS